MFPAKKPAFTHAAARVPIAMPAIPAVPMRAPIAAAPVAMAQAPGMDFAGGVKPQIPGKKKFGTRAIGRIANISAPGVQLPKYGA
jgi:hypothetical protein